jgi:dCMP deaminase
MIGPRTDFLTWDDTWMAIAHVIARRSKDPSTQVGAVIVDVSNNILGIGYNGLPRGCDSNKFPWNRTGNCLDTKYMYVSHAEANAIDNSNRSRIKGSKI